MPIEESCGISCWFKLSYSHFLSYSSNIYIVHLDCQYESLIGNGICNQEANNEDCQYDGGDCCYADCKICSDGNCNSDASKCIGNTEAGGKLFVITKINICKL